MRRLYAVVVKGISLIIKALAVAGLLFSIVKLSVEDNNRGRWLTFLLFNILLYVAAGLLSVLLSKKFPPIDIKDRKKSRSGPE